MWTSVSQWEKIRSDRNFVWLAGGQQRGISHDWLQRSQKVKERDCYQTREIRPHCTISHHVSRGSVKHDWTWLERWYRTKHFPFSLKLKWWSGCYANRADVLFSIHGEVQNWCLFISEGLFLQHSATFQLTFALCWCTIKHLKSLMFLRLKPEFSLKWTRKNIIMLL